MNPETMLRINAGGRVAIGLLALAAPKRLAAGWIGADGNRPGVTVLTRALGARDLVIGAGALLALAAGQPVRPWALAALVADTTDAVATAATSEALPAAGFVGTLAIATGAAAQDAFLAARLR